MPTPTTVQARFQVRADTAANWTAANPTLLLNEIGIETDTKKLKLGDGTTVWASLDYFPSIVTGGTVLGNLEIGTTGTLTFEGSTADGFETTLAVTDPTADRTITLPNITGTVVTTGDTGTVTSTMIADDTIVNADINASAAIAGTKISPSFGSQNVVTTGTSSAASFIPTSTTVPHYGMYMPTASTVAISGNGGLRFQVAGNESSFPTTAGGTVLLVDAVNNRTGIGTGTPSNPLHVFSASISDVVRLDSNNATSGVRQTFVYSGSSIGGIGSAKFSDATLALTDLGLASGANLDFITNQLFRARITSAGNFGINDASPDAKLTVNGVASFGAGAAATPSIAARGDLDTGIFFPAANTTAISTGGSERMRIGNDGNVLIGQTTNSQSALLALSSRTKTSTNTPKLAVDCSSSGVGINSVANSTGGRTHIEFENGALVGSITTHSSTTAFNTTSDYRLKQDIQPLIGATDRLKLLKPSCFRFIRTPEAIVDGFIAHEVQDVVPEAVHGEKDAVDENGNPKYQGIDQSKLVPLLTAALQEAISEIESLKARLDAASL